MKYTNLLGLCVFAVALSACNQEPPISASSTYMLDELAQSPTYFPQVTRTQMLESLAQGDVISIGESHDVGLQRQYLADLYQDLAPGVNPLPVECMVETGGSSNGSTTVAVPLLDMDGPSDPVRAEWSKLCGTGHEFDNPVNDYTSALAQYVPQGRVATHTGARHMLPWALMYALDFPDAQWVDTPPTGTINRQLPSDFYKEGKQVRQHAVWSLDELLMPQLQTEMQAALNKGTAPDQVAKAAQADTAMLLSSHALTFAPGEEAHVFEVHRVALSFPNQIAYMSILNQPAFSPALLNNLMASQALVQFLQQVDPSTIQAGVFRPATPNESTVIGGNNVAESGTIYFEGTVKNSPNESVSVLVSPTKVPQMQVTQPTNP